MLSPLPNPDATPHACPALHKILDHAITCSENYVVTTNTTMATVSKAALVSLTVVGLLLKIDHLLPFRLKVRRRRRTVWSQGVEGPGLQLAPCQPATGWSSC